MNDDQEFNFTFFSSEEIERRFNTIIEKCQSIESSEEIIKIIDETLYNRLILTHEFKDLPKLIVYRVVKTYEEFNPDLLSSYSHPSKDKSKLGRANLKGHPVFYCSFNEATALREMKEDLQVGQTLYISEWHIKATQSVFAHTLMLTSKTMAGKGFAAGLVKTQIEQLHAMLGNVPEPVKEGAQRLQVGLGDLFTLSGSENYKITSAYAHDVLYSAEMKGANFSMIMYPSVVADEWGINFAIHPDFVSSSMMECVSVTNFTVKKIKDDGVDVAASRKGFLLPDGRIDWKKPTISIKEIEYDQIQIWTHNKSTFKGEEALNMPINKSTRLVKDFVKEELTKYERTLLNGLTQVPVKDYSLDFTYAERKHLLLLQCEHGCKVETPAGSNGGCNCISTVQVPITWIDEYR